MSGTQQVIDRLQVAKADKAETEAETEAKTEASHLPGLEGRHIS